MTAAAAAHGASVQTSTGAFGCAASSPAVNNNVSPGRKGKSNPVSRNTMSITPGSTADANGPPLPNQYIGSISSGRATTMLVTAAEPNRLTWPTVEHGPTTGAAPPGGRGRSVIPVSARAGIVVTGTE